ncbi:hypothetical protein SDC9_198776 [bioreactor metagenome]|uniref:Uncharacterized protein n=1 Tax=bioreactor metagenome TaxID=1076179 RepID=A0A645IRV6_9ZZZZ
MKLQTDQFASRSFSRPDYFIEHERRGGVAIGMGYLQGRFPDVAIARLRIGFLGAFRGLRLRADRLLIETTVFTDFEIQLKRLGLKTKPLLGWQRPWLAAIGHDDLGVRPVGMVMLGAITAVCYTQNQHPDTAHVYIY